MLYIYIYVYIYIHIYIYMASIFHSSSGLACTSSPTRPKEREGRGEEEKGGLSRGTEMSEDLPPPFSSIFQLPPLLLPYGVNEFACARQNYVGGGDRGGYVEKMEPSDQQTKSFHPYP
jgi:hypothetical protein